MVVLAPSFRRILARWISTVRWEIPSTLPMVLLLWPAHSRQDFPFALRQFVHRRSADRHSPARHRAK